MLNFLLNAQYHLECIIEVMYCMNLNVLISYLGCKLCEHTDQIC